MAATPSDINADLSPRVFRRHWGWLLAFGIVQLIAGAFAIATPTLASLVAVALFGWLMLASAVFQIIHAVRVRRWKGFLLHLLGGVLYAAAGILALLNPFSGMLALTLVVAALFLADGVLRIALAMSVRQQQEGWGWMLAGGLASVILGGMLLFGMPATAMWALGLLLGINLMFSGVMNAALAMTCRQKQKREEPHGGDAGHRHAPTPA